jgi:hypothetical protein
MVWIGLIWLRIGASGWLLWTRQWTSGFHKTLWSSWVAAQLAASQEGLSSMSEWESEWLNAIIHNNKANCILQINLFYILEISLGYELRLQIGNWVVAMCAPIYLTKCTCSCSFPYSSNYPNKSVVLNPTTYSETENSFCHTLSNSGMDRLNERWWLWENAKTSLLEMQPQRFVHWGLNDTA